MNYDVKVAYDAEEYTRRPPPRTRYRILSRLEQISSEPFGHHTKQLKNAQGRRAARVGDYRIVFAIDEAERDVRVSAIGPRGDVYRDL